MRKSLLVLTVAALAAALAAPSAPAQAPERDATASAGFIFIKGPTKLPARKKLRIPLSCTVPCNVKATFTLALPGPNLGPRTILGTLSPTVPKDLVIGFNDAATKFLKDHIRGSKLKLKVRATDAATGSVALARKVFRFKRG